MLESVAVVTAMDKQGMVSSFLEIAVGQSAETARQFLEATNWKLEEAIQLYFYVGNEEKPHSSSSRVAPAAVNKDSTTTARNDDIDHDDDVRPPIPVIREALYGAMSSRMDDDPSNESISSSSSSSMMGVWDDQESLAALYRPPFALMHRGRFEQAKQTAAIQDKWLIVNLQSTKEFTSHMLNRDTWGNEAVAQTISANFIFWQAYDEDNSIEGRKVCTYYKLSSIPVVLLIDPITGQKMKSWNGMIHPDRLLEVLMPFMEGSPKDYLHKRRLPRENFKQPTYPPLPEEPKGVDKSLLCRVALRLPVDGRRCQRTFLRTDPLKLLWSFCSSQLEEADQAHRPFRLTNSIPTASKVLDYESEMTIGESNLENSLIFVTWE